MTTYKDTDLESLIEDLKEAWMAETEAEKQEQLRILYLKTSKDKLDKLYELAELYSYHYDKVYGMEMLEL